MLGDSTGQKNIDPQAIACAIESLKSKGWDINPYTVADEAQIPRITLLRNKTLMDLVAKAKHGAPVTADEAIRQLEELEECNRALEERIAELELEKVSFLKDKQDAFYKLSEDGKLIHLDYEQVQKSHIFR